MNRINVKYQLIKYKIFHLFKKEIGVSLQNKRDKKIIVSLTSYPQRFDAVHLTIETLLNQTLKPDKIILWLSEEEVSNIVIPSHIEKLKKRGVEIRFVSENLKSYKKLIYTLKEFKNEIIITVDDDVLYPNYLIEGLYKKYLNYKDCVIAYRCSVMYREDKDRLAPYLSWKQARNIQTSSFELFPTGVGGVLYPPNTLHRDTVRKELFLKLSPTADDVWFKAMALLKGTKTVQVYENYREFPIVDGSQEDALWKINNDKNQNDVQLKKVFDYYDLYHLIGKGKI